MTDPTTLRVGMVGYAFMGAAHSHAWRTAPRFFDLPLRPELTAIAGRNAAGVRAAADKMGWASAETDWRALIERDDIDLIDICTPGNTHAEIAIAALEAGKHVLCEKPLANSVAEAERMAAAADAAAARGVYSMCGFSYRRTPALALARRMVAEGRLGQIRHVRAQYLQDWLSDAGRAADLAAGQGQVRLRRARGHRGPQHRRRPVDHRTEHHRGLGAAGNLRHRTPRRRGPRGPGRARRHRQRHRARARERGRRRDLHRPLRRRPFRDRRRNLHHRHRRRPSGPIGVFEATRFALGRKNAMRLELNGTAGSLAFDFEDMNALSVYDAADGPDAGFRKILVTEPEHPYTGNWWPTGHGLGYEHLFTHQVVDLIDAIAANRPPAPSFADALQVQKVLAAVETSAHNNSHWHTV